MKRRIKNKIEHLRKQPEDVRLRAATILTMISGALVVVLWVAVLLPAQIYFGKPDKDTGEQRGLVQGIRDAIDKSGPALEQETTPEPTEQAPTPTPRTRRTQPSPNTQGNIFYRPTPTPTSSPAGVDASPSPDPAQNSPAPQQITLPEETPLEEENQ